MVNTWNAYCQCLNMFTMQSMVEDSYHSSHDGPSTCDTTTQPSNAVIDLLALDVRCHKIQIQNTTHFNWTGTYTQGQKPSKLIVNWNRFCFDDISFGIDDLDVILSEKLELSDVNIFS